MDAFKRQEQATSRRGAATGGEQASERGVAKGAREAFDKNRESKELLAEEGDGEELRSKDRAREEGRKAATEVLTTLQLLCAEAAFFAR